MFGNRLGNCAYDKIFLKNIKNSKSPSHLEGISPFRPANYPKVSSVQANVSESTVASNTTSITGITSDIKPPSACPVLAKSPLNLSAVAYDESVFDNSMMISEEDLISDENFCGMEFENDNCNYLRRRPNFFNFSMESTWQ